MKRIDAHQHFWRLSRNDYGWLTPELTTLYKDFLPSDLTPLLKQHNIDATLLVQAAPTEAETDFLLNLADQNDSIKGIIGWVDFDSPLAPERIVYLARHSKLVGLRPMIQDIEDIDWMLSPAVGNALQSLDQHKLVFDALVKPEHLKNLKTLVGRHPSLKVVINHAAKPNIKTQDIEQWQRDIKAFRDHPQVSCKLSGLVTEAKSDWQATDIYPYIDILFDVFGDQRILWGSDWPVCLLASSYGEWINTVEAYLQQSDHSEEAIFGGNAVDIYQLNR